MGSDEESVSCQWPDCDGPVDVRIWADQTGPATLRVAQGSIELVPHPREGTACGVHAQIILARLPRDGIAKVQVWSDPDDPEECDPPEAEAIRAILRDWPHTQV